MRERRLRHQLDVDGRVNNRSMSSIAYGDVESAALGASQSETGPVDALHLGLTDRTDHCDRLVTHGPMPPIRVIEYRTMKPGSDPSGMGTSASGET